MGMAGRTERRQAVEIEVRAPLGALDDVVDLEGGYSRSVTGLATTSPGRGLRADQGTPALLVVSPSPGPL